MDTLSLEEKKAQFDEFYVINHELKANIKPLGSDEVLPAYSELEDSMPYAFRIASEMSALDAAALRPLRGLSDHASALADYLNHQSKKIDLMMSYILHQQDEPEYRFLTVKFGGGGIVIHSPSPLKVGTAAQIKLFLSEEAAAIFCYGEVITCQQNEDDYHIAFIFTRIREQDQELLVRASLHLQTLQLRKRAQARGDE
ncbi:PilZ domain-containing protein [Salinimonas sp. HHU 13199]|uniref:PilZ domain-containing protein n=1 Tax=Salinimonas profundi TaxID=2729140 RepID=A0ABR8LGM0_9ALTE|nr:PilZ domain-containing protein [Salinimonas profundi]MBD3584857.1 PilZ domain-containing protein [Salinimonas profundi]